ncbi:MAG TPA: MFS transporter [Ardenticatenaceae bacterium]|nr:MFS transporter [Ardenticatenaceae bacterium]
MTATSRVLPRHLTLLDQVYVSCFWLAYNVHWGALLAIVLPSQIAAIVGDAEKEFYNGLIPPLGALVSLLITPVAGALSDRSRSRFGRRRPFMLVGTLINVLFLVLIAGFGPGSSIWLFLLCYMGIQFGNNWSGGPYAGLIPDVVPEEQRGSASGWLGLMTAIGTLVGALAAGQLIEGTNFWPIYGLIIAALVTMLGLTWWGVRERPGPGAPERFAWRPFLRSFWLDPATYRDFYWVLITRGLVTMGIYSVINFFLFFLQDVIRVPDPAQQASLLVGIIIAAGIPTSIVAGALSDRFGRKRLVYLSGGLMALVSLIYIAVAAYPSLAFTFVMGGLFGLGYGAYQAVDWALAVDVLPGGEDAAKDMGIWHVALVLPQILAPAISGLTLNALKEHSLLLGYTVVFALAAFWFLLGTVLVRQVRGVR